MIRRRFLSAVAGLIPGLAVAKQFAGSPIETPALPVGDNSLDNSLGCRFVLDYMGGSDDGAVWRDYAAYFPVPRDN